MNRSFYTVALTLLILLPLSTFARSEKSKLKSARAECLKEKPALKGKQLKRCIRDKMLDKSKGTAYGEDVQK